jgi:hypothetical protein
LNGTAVNHTSYRDIPITDHEEVVIAYGAPPGPKSHSTIRVSILSNENINAALAVIFAFSIGYWFQNKEDFQFHNVQLNQLNITI